MIERKAFSVVSGLQRTTRLNPFAVKLGDESKLQTIIKVAKACESPKHKGYAKCLVRDGMVCFFAHNPDSEFRLFAGLFGLECEDINALDGFQAYIFIPHFEAELKARRAMLKLIGSVESTRPIRAEAFDMVPDASKMKRKEFAAALVDKLRELPTDIEYARYAKPTEPPKEVSTVSTVSTPAPMPVETPVAITKVAATPTFAARRKRFKPAENPETPTVSQTVSIVDALRKLGVATKKQLIAAGVDARTWSESLSEAYRARLVVRDYARKDDVWHMLAK